MDIVLLLLSFTLIVAPGAWIAFTLFGDDTPYVVRLALALGLAPVCLGLQLLLAAKFGVNFGQAAFAALFVNLAAFSFMRPRRPRMPHPPIWPIAVVTLAFTIVFGLLWLVPPAFREYSWHNMMQMAIVYEIADWPNPLEELDLAGFAVNYAYIGHIQITAIGLIANLSPLKIFPIVNLAMLFATVVLLTYAVDRLRPGRIVSSTFGTTVALMTTNLASVAYGQLIGAAGPGDVRVAMLVRKFANFDSMTIGMALFAGMIYLAIVSLQAPSLRARFGLLLCAAGIGLVYPLLFPPAALLAGTALVMPPLLRLVSGKPLGLTADDGWTVVGLGGAVAIFAAYLASMSTSGGEPSATISSIRDIWWGVKVALIAGILWLPLMALAALPAWRTRDGAALTLMVASAASVSLTLVVKLAILSQYKFTMAGLFMALPLVVVQGLDLLDRLGRAAVPVGAAITAAILVIMVPHMTRTLVPWDMMAHAAPMAENGFYVEPGPRAGAQWAIAVRDQTPRAAVLLSPPSSDPVSIWTRRASYIAEDGARSTRVGYSMTAMEILAGVKRLPLAVIDERNKVMHAIYGGDAGIDFPAILSHLTALGRPVAIYGAPDLPFLGWLRARALGHQIFADGAGLVWLITPEEYARHAGKLVVGVNNDVAK